MNTDQLPGYGLRMLARLATGYQVRDDRQTRHTVLHAEPHRVLRRYGPGTAAAERPPVLLVPPLAVSARCYDLGPGQSAVEQLLELGRRPYVVDFGDVTRADAHLGFADYFDDIVPQAIARTLADSGADRVDLVGWSLGGTISLLTAAAHPALPIRSVTAIGTPLDYDAIPPYPTVKRVLPPAGTTLVAGTLRALGGIPAPIVRLGYRATAWERELRKPAYIVRNANDSDALARMQVIDRFQDSMPGYPGRAAVEMWRNFVYRNELAGGVVDFAGRRIDLTTITQPVQLFGSHRDAIASWRAARHGVDLLTGADRVRFATVEASHLGLIAGAEATAETWPRVAEFLAELDQG